MDVKILGLDSPSPCASGKPQAKIFKIKIASWALLLVSILVEYFLFRHYLLNNIVNHYPTQIDQANYLFQSYSLYESIVKNGLFSALLQRPLTPTSFLFSIQAALFFLVSGASRIAALSLNFLYFALLQIVVFHTLKKMTDRYFWGFLFVGLLLSTGSFFIYGGAIDFRIDFMALCLYGMLTCFILLSGVFVRRGWVLASALLAAFLIAMRFLTLVYVAGVAAAMLAYFALVFWYQKTWKLCFPDSASRMKNIVLFAFLVGLVSAPILWWHRELLYSYYLYGHVYGPEKLMRAKIAGIHDGFANLVFYPLVFIFLHLTLRIFVEIVLVFLVLLAVDGVFYWGRRDFFVLGVGEKSDFSHEMVFLLVCCLVPLFALTLDTSKSMLVVNVVLVPFLLLVLWAYGILYRRMINFLPGWHGLLGYYFALLFFVGGMCSFVKDSMFSVPQYSHLTDADVMINAIGDYAASVGWKDIYATEDKYTDFFPSIGAFYYEKRKILFNFTAAMGSGSQCAVPDRMTALASVVKSNVFVTNVGNFVPNDLFRFESSIKTFRPQLRATARKNMIELGSYRVNDSPYIVYVRPDVKILGTTGTETWVWVPAVVMQQVKTLLLDGDVATGVGQNEIGMDALAFDEGQKASRHLAANVKISGGHCLLSVSLPKDTRGRGILLRLNSEALGLLGPWKKSFVLS